MLKICWLIVFELQSDTHLSSPPHDQQQYKLPQYHTQMPGLSWPPCFSRPCDYCKVRSDVVLPLCVLVRPCRQWSDLAGSEPGRMDPLVFGNHIHVQRYLAFSWRNVKRISGIGHADLENSLCKQNKDLLTHRGGQGFLRHMRCPESIAVH